MLKSVIAANIRRLRLEQGLSQEDAASLAGVSRLTFGRIESGKHAPRIETLQDIAIGFGVTVEHLMAQPVLFKKVRFRSRKTLKSREAILSDVRQWLETFRDLESRIGATVDGNAVLEKIRERADSRSPKPLAAAAREVLGLDENSPVTDLCGLLEQHGIKVYPYPAATDGFFGLCANEDDLGPALVVNTWERISVERWIFTAAHEFGHLLMHFNDLDADESIEDPESKVEREADTFAAHFLMPTDAFKAAWDQTAGSPYVSRVLRVKDTFKISYKAVIVRLTERMDSDKSKEYWIRFYSEFNRTYGYSLAGKKEPNPIAQVEFRRKEEPGNMGAVQFRTAGMMHLLKRAYDLGAIAIADAARILQMDQDRARSILEDPLVWG